jgi:hypothetical protein
MDCQIELARQSRNFRYGSSVEIMPRTNWPAASGRLGVVRIESGRRTQYGHERPLEPHAKYLLASQQARYARCVEQEFEHRQWLKSHRILLLR